MSPLWHSTRLLLMLSPRELLPGQGHPAPSTARCWSSQILSSPSITSDESLDSTPSSTTFSLSLRNGSEVVPRASFHHSPAPSVVLGSGCSPSPGRALLALRAELWDRKRPALLAMPEAKTPPQDWEHPGQPQLWPPAHGSGDRQSCPTIVFPSSLGWQGIGLQGGEQHLGRAVPWQEPAWPEGPSPEPDPDSRSSPASSRRRQPHAMDGRGSVATAGAEVPASRLATGQDTSQGTAAKRGPGAATAQRKPVPTCAAGCKHVHKCHPPGSQATAVTTLSFYSLHLYIHGIKPSSATRLHQASAGTAQTGPLQW